MSGGDATSRTGGDATARAGGADDPSQLDPGGRRRVGRRALLLAGAGVVVGASACSSDSDVTSPGRFPGSRQLPTSGATGGEVTGSPAPTSERPTLPTLPTVDVWSPDRADVEPRAKAAAVGAVTALGTWQHFEGTVAAAGRRLAASGQDGRLAGRCGPLLGRAEAAAVEIIEAQYGGLSGSGASVLVVCRQWFADADHPLVAGGTTVDVRLTRGSAGWRITAIHPARLPAPAHPVPRLALAVLRSRRIELPPAARADVASGAVHDTVLAGLLRLADDFRLAVSVIRSGHPTYVFGTDRVSDHTDGRAFDTWRVDGRAVVDARTPRTLVTRYLEAAATAGAYNIGGPHLPTTGDPRFFSDATHHDHVHVAFAS